MATTIAIYDWRGADIQTGYTPVKSTTKTSTIINVQKTLEAEGTYTANDVMSESDTNGEGTAWTFAMGGTGRITQAAAVTPTTARTAAILLFIYSALPTCELDDNAANTGPLVADMPNYVGSILLPALKTYGGPAQAQSTLTNPLTFDTSTLYVVAVDTTGEDFGDDTTLNIILSAELDV
jgi:hypothetical protein